MARTMHVLVHNAKERDAKDGGARARQLYVKWLATMLGVLGVVDVVLLQEAYWLNFTPLSRRGWHVVHAAGQDGDTAVLVRPGLRRGGGFVEKLTKRWWGVLHPVWRSPRAVATIKAGGVRWASVHIAAGPRNAKNKASVTEHAGALARMLRGSQRAFIAGDWNFTAGQFAVGSPAYLAARDAAAALIPFRGVDNAVAKGVRVTEVRKLKSRGMSDHPAWLVTLEVD